MIHLSVGPPVPNQTLFLIFISRREKYIYPLLKDLRDYRMMAILWFLSVVARKKIQMGPICFVFV